MSSIVLVTPQRTFIGGGEGDGGVGTTGRMKGGGGGDGGLSGLG